MLNSKTTSPGSAPELKAVRTELKDDTSELRADVKAARTELKDDIAELRAELKDIKTDVNDLRVAVARLEGPTPRLELARG